MRICHVTTLHPPDDVRIWLKECRTLAAAGHEVVLLARVDGRRREDGVDVRPVGVTAVRTGIPNLVRRLARAFRAARAVGADVVHLHDPELVPLGLALKATRTRVVYDAHEDTPREVVALAPPGSRGARLLGAAWALALFAAARAFDGFVAATPAIARRFPARNTALVRNYPLREEFASPRGRSAGGRVVAYVGSLTRVRGLPQLVEAIGRVRGEATLVLAGEVDPRDPGLLDELRALPGWERVRFEGLVDRERVATLLAEARAGLVLFQPVATHLDALPNKLFEYMAAGLPVVASDFAGWREIVQGAGCGVLVDPADPDAIARAVERVLGDPAEAAAMGDRGRAAFERAYTWEAEADALLRLYERLA